MDTIAQKTENQSWDLEIKPKSGLFELNMKEVWAYRDLMWLFVRRDFVAQYKQTVLGPLWHFIQPILTTIMFLFVFGRIARIPTDGIKPEFLFYLSGITIWNYFSTCLTSTSTTFTSNAHIFGKVYFPRLVLPLSIVISNLIKFGIQLLFLFIAMIYAYLSGYSITINTSILLIPFLLIIMAGIGLGLGIIISSVTTKYRDFAILISFAIQLYMYATPIAYPLSYLKEKGYAWIVEINPLTPVVEAFRFALFGQGSFTIGSLFYSTMFMTIIFFIGAIMFQKVEKTFMDTV